MFRLSGSIKWFWHHVRRLLWDGALIHFQWRTENKNQCSRLAVPLVGQFVPSQGSAVFSFSFSSVCWCSLVKFLSSQQNKRNKRVLIWSYDRVKNLSFSLSVLSLSPPSFAGGCCSQSHWDVRVFQPSHPVSATTRSSFLLSSWNRRTDLAHGSARSNKCATSRAKRLSRFGWPDNRALNHLATRAAIFLLPIRAIVA